MSAVTPEPPAPRDALARIGDRWQVLPGLERLPARDAAVLTFDDGPDPDGTPAVLDALDEAGVRATFFVLGTHLVRHRTLAEETLARGHELALHGFRHVDYDCLARGEAREEIARGVWAFEAVLGVQPRWFRPPFGRITEEAHDACHEFSLEPVYWSAIGRDWERASAQAIAQAVTEQLAAGVIVLLHDSACFAPRPSAHPTATALKLIADQARRRGIELRPVGELVCQP